MFIRCLYPQSKLRLVWAHVNLCHLSCVIYLQTYLQVMRDIKRSACKMPDHGNLCLQPGHPPETRLYPGGFGD